MRYPNDDQSYYSRRAAISRDLAERATNPVIAAIHADFATRYDLLGRQSERPHADTAIGAQAA